MKKTKILAITLTALLLLQALVACVAKKDSGASTSDPLASGPASTGDPDLQPGEHVTKEYYDSGKVKKEEIVIVNIHRLIHSREIKLYRESGTLEKRTVYKMGVGIDLVIFSEETFRDDGSDLTYTEYYKNGNKKLENFFMQDGNLERKVEYFEDGKMSRDEGYYAFKVEKYTILYYANGNKKQETKYYNDNKNHESEIINYSEDGFVIDKRTFYEGNGNWKETIHYFPGSTAVRATGTYYNNTENTRKTEIYYNEDGSVRSYMEWNEQGKLIKNDQNEQ